MTRSRSSLTRRELFSRVFRGREVPETSDRCGGKERSGLTRDLRDSEAPFAAADNTERVLREMDNPRGLADP
jgi:hypothetical protein